MGISIHYRGRLNDIGLLEKLCDEVGDIAHTMVWPAVELDDDWSEPPNASLRGGDPGTISGHLGLKGIEVTPHAGSEPLTLFFDRDGNLRSPMTMISILDGTLEPETAWVSMKTQFSTPDTHIRVIAVLKYLKRHYISDLEVSDEGELWGTGNREDLVRKMAFFNGKLEHLSSALSRTRLGDLADLSAVEIASRIEELLQKEEQDRAEVPSEDKA